MLALSVGRGLGVVARASPLGGSFAHPPAIFPTQLTPMMAAALVPTRTEETQLMVAFQSQRSQASFEALYQATAPAMLAWIERTLTAKRLSADPRDLLQDTFVNVYRYAGSFRPEATGGFRAWVRTIAANALRRARRRPAVLGANFSELGDTFDAAADRRSSPLAAAADTEATHQLGRAYGMLLLHYALAFETLKERDQRALHLVEVEGVSYAEVGRRLGVGRSNTKMIVFRARQRLRAQLERTLGIQESNFARTAMSQPCESSGEESGERAA